VTLRSLEALNLVERKKYPEVPPRVEYSLSPLGKSLLPKVRALVEWALENREACLSKG
ncbi:MAG: helix-turn-helix domain-containing protein, partial [Bacteroidales bacterium]